MPFYGDFIYGTLITESSGLREWGREKRVHAFRLADRQVSFRQAQQSSSLLVSAKPYSFHSLFILSDPAVYLLIAFNKVYAKLWYNYNYSYYSSTFDGRNLQSVGCGVVCISFTSIGVQV